MQIINNGGGSTSLTSGTLITAGGNTNLVLAGGNVNGLLILAASLFVSATAISSNVQARLGFNAASWIFGGLAATPAGAAFLGLNYVMPNSILIPPGQSLDVNVAITAGSGAVGYSVVYRVL